MCIRMVTPLPTCRPTGSGGRPAHIPCMCTTTTPPPKILTRSSPSGRATRNRQIVNGVPYQMRTLTSSTQLLVTEALACTFRILTRSHVAAAATQQKHSCTLMRSQGFPRIWFCLLPTAMAVLGSRGILPDAINAILSLTACVDACGP